MKILRLTFDKFSASTFFLFCFSDVECKDDIYSVRQLEARRASEQLRKENSNNNQEDILLEPLPSQEKHDLISTSEDKNIEPKIAPIIAEKRIRPQAVTASIFKDRVPDKKDIFLTNDITSTGEKKEKQLPWIFQVHIFYFV